MAWLVHLTTNTTTITGSSNNATTNAKKKEKKKCGGGGFGTNPDSPIDLDGLAKQCVLYPSGW